MNFFNGLGINLVLAELTVMLSAAYLRGMQAGTARCYVRGPACVRARHDRRAVRALMQDGQLACGAESRSCAQ